MTAIIQGNRMDIPTSYQSKKLIIFDLDGTIAESKSAADEEMLDLLSRLFLVKKVAVVSGGAFPQFEKQLIARFPSSVTGLENFYCFPTNGTRAYHYDQGWRETYAELLSEEEKKVIIDAFEASFVSIGYTHPQQRWGIFIEDRGTQITFSALGQEAPVEEKNRLKALWEETGTDPRPAIGKYLEAHIPNFEIRLNGMSSIDVTRKGIDKAYAIKQMEKDLGILRSDMLFVGDAIYPGGNDYAAVEAGVDYVKVSGPAETKTVIRQILKEYTS